MISVTFEGSIAYQDGWITKSFPYSLSVMAVMWGSVLRSPKHLLRFCLKLTYHWTRSVWLEDGLQKTRLCNNQPFWHFHELSLVGASHGCLCCLPNTRYWRKDSRWYCWGEVHLGGINTILPQSLTAKPPLKSYIIYNYISTFPKGKDRLPTIHVQGQC